MFFLAQRLCRGAFQGKVRGLFASRSCIMELSKKWTFRRLARVPCVLLPIFSSDPAATIVLTCSYTESLEVKKQTTSPAAGQFSLQIQTSGERVVHLASSKGDWCDPNSGVITEIEISFACAFDLAGQRVSSTYTLNRVTGGLEQRLFMGGRLAKILFGHCIAPDL